MIVSVSEDASLNHRTGNNAGDKYDRRYGMSGLRIGRGMRANSEGICENSGFRVRSCMRHVERERLVGS